MSHSSIFDKLYTRRQPVSEPVEEAVQVLSDFDAERLRIVDGIALTPAGFVGQGEVPETHSPELSSELHGIDGFRLPIHQIADLPDVDEPELARYDSKALRVHQLMQSIVVEALMMLEAIPESAGFDIVFSAPLNWPKVATIIGERLQAVAMETQYGERLGEVRHVTSGEPHTILKAPEQGGMPYVLWIGADSLINEEDIASPENRGLMVQSSRDSAAFPGEAVAAVLVQRLQEDETDFDSGWELKRGIVDQHPKRSDRRDYERKQQVLGIFSELFPEADSDSESEESSDDADETATPVRVVVDSLDMSGRAVEVGGAVTECWPQIEMLVDCLGADSLSGWSGEAMLPLSMVVALAPLAPEENAVVLSLQSENHSDGWLLRSYAAAHVDND